MHLRELHKNEIEPALKLVWKVFSKYEAPEYSKRGVDEFYNSIYDSKYLSRLHWYGAFLNAELVGIIATRNKGSHIALFFVDGRYHNKGIGKSLFEFIKKDCLTDNISVNSSPYAVPIYHRLGFENTDSEQITNGVRYTPMKLKLSTDRKA